MDITKQLIIFVRLTPLIDQMNYKFLKFFIPSIFGLLFFVVPLPYGQIIGIEGMASVNIGIGALSDLLRISLSDNLMMLSTVVVCGSAIITLITTLLARFITIPSRFINSLFNVTPFWLLCRIVGGVFVAMVVAGVGPEIIISDDSGGAMIHLIPSLLAVFFFTGYLLPLILDFGLMDFLGTLISKQMYRLFKVPGRAAIDAISSWLGDGTLGVMITDAQYRGGYYTAKEAAIISVCFSMVSLPFSTVIADQLGLMPIFLSFYGTVCLSSFACAVILPRIYPLCRFKDRTFNDVEHLKEEISYEGSIFRYALNRAMTRAESAPSFGSVMREGVRFTMDLYFALLPLCMAWGTIALIITNYTPLFEYISLPFKYLFELCNIPDATVAAPAVLVGFTDMFIPSIMVAGEEISIITKFIIGVLSVSQLIYLSETGAVILKSNIPLNLRDLFVIYLLRTFISLPIIIIVAKLLF